MHFHNNVDLRLCVANAAIQAIQKMSTPRQRYELFWIALNALQWIGDDVSMEVLVYGNILCALKNERRRAITVVRSCERPNRLVLKYYHRRADGGVPVPRTARRVGKNSS